MDNFDPAIVDGLAPAPPVLALDYRGVGGSGGQPPLTVAEMSRDLVAVIGALGFEQVDLIGFSLGGFVAQQIVLDHPALIRKGILAGSGRPVAMASSASARCPGPSCSRACCLHRSEDLPILHSTANGRRAAKAFLDRLKERTADRDKPATFGPLLRQLKAIKAWGLQAPQDLSKVAQPVLVANGDHDIMVPTSNSRDLARRLPNAELVIYEDAGHGGIFLNHAVFVSEALAFLDARSQPDASPWARGISLSRST